MLLGVHLDIWKQGQTFMYLKIEVSAITGFFSEILEHSHLTFLAQLHDKISSLNQTESNLDYIFALFIPFYICVLCYSSAVQLRGPLHQKKKYSCCFLWSNPCSQNTTTHCGFAQNPSVKFEKSYTHFQCSIQTGITQTDYLCVQNPTKLFVTEKFSLPD